VAFGHEQKLLIAVAHTIRGTVDRDWPEFERAFRAEWAAATARIASTAPRAELDEEVVDSPPESIA